MAIQKQVDLIKSDVSQWNEWRRGVLSQTPYPWWSHEDEFGGKIIGLVEEESWKLDHPDAEQIDLSGEDSRD